MGLGWNLGHRAMIGSGCDGVLAVQEVRKARIWIPVRLLCPASYLQPFHGGWGWPYLAVYVIRRRRTQGLVYLTLQT